MSANVSASSSGHSPFGRSGSRPRFRLLTAAVLAVAVVLTAAGPASALPVSTAQDRATTDLRVGVLSLAGAIAAVGQTPELAEPLPFTRTSLADVLGLDGVMTRDLEDALAGTDLEDAMNEVPGVTGAVLSEDGQTLTFGFSRSVTQRLDLVQDDGDLRFSGRASAGSVTVSLATPEDGEKFVVRVDEDQEDPLLKFALVSQPELDLSVDIDNPAVAGFAARQGFTAVTVTGGRYTIHRDADITLRDPDGRSLLTLEDLRWSTLPDLFRIVRTDDRVAVGLDLELPGSVAVRGGPDTAREGTLEIAGTPPDATWATAADATRTYGDALAAATGVSAVDGIAALSKYTGATLALQDVADVDFPQLSGGTGDLFAPGDQLLDLLSTAAVAQIRCGRAPGSPPGGTPAPGDTTYCQAVTPATLGKVTSATWTVNGGDGVLVTDAAGQKAAVGPAPEGTVRIDGSDGEPDLSVTLTTGTDARARTFTARTLPRTVQDVVARIRGLGDPAGPGEEPAAAATVDLDQQRLDVDVHLREDSTTRTLPVGNPGTLGALVGLTGLEDDEGAAVATTATGARFDVGFGVSTRAPDAAGERATVLLPGSDRLLSIAGLSAAAPQDAAPLQARIGFLGVDARVSDVALGQATGSDAVELSLTDRVAPTAGAGLPLDALLDESGALDPTTLDLRSTVTADISFTAQEQPLPAGPDGVVRYATGQAGGRTGAAQVHWPAAGVPDVRFGDGYAALRVFDPVPAEFLDGTVSVVDGAPDTVTVTVDDSGRSLHERLRVAPAPDGGATEVARRLMGPGVGCQNVTLTSGTQLTCTGLAPRGEAALSDGDRVQLIVLGDPFALRDGILEGLSGALNSFERLDADNLPAGERHPDDQYSSTLPLVDLTPAQLAAERDALRSAMVTFADAATQDEGGLREEVGGPAQADLAPVSSAQELSAAAADADVLPGTRGLRLDVSAGRLGVTLGAASTTPTTRSAPLRFSVPGVGQVVGTGTPVDVSVDSATDLAIDVTTATARPAITDATGTRSHAEVDLGRQLAGTPLRIGAGDARLAASGSSAVLGVDVATTYDEGSALLQTRRTTDRSGGLAAVADLVVEGQETPLHYEAPPTSSSGGAGAEQPAPEPMQVQYVAEGLDGLATALGQALDGAAPRNAGPDGAPVSAPLIGTDLGAGADVTGTLTGLTSALRDRLAGLDATDPDEVAAELERRVDAAVGAAAGVSLDRSATATLTCAGKPCAADQGPEVWDQVRITLSVTGDETTRQVPFDVGLAGLAVRSNKKIDTTSSWRLPLDLRLTRGVGPQVSVGSGDALSITTRATLPTGGLDAIVGVLPARLTSAGDGGDTVDVGVDVRATEPLTYDLFDLYDGALRATPAFRGGEGLGAEDGLDLRFDTKATGTGTFDLSGRITVNWTPTGFGDVLYDDVEVDMGQVVQSMATPFKVVDPYLGPVRDVVDVLRTPLPVVSDLSQLGGGDEISLLSLLATLGGGDARLELATRVIQMVGFTADLVSAIAAYKQENAGDTTVPLEALGHTGALLKVDPSEVELYSSCTQTVKTRTGSGPTATQSRKVGPCEDVAPKKKKGGAAGQSATENRRGTRAGLDRSISQRATNVTGTTPGFSVPFLEDPDQLLDLVTGEGEATYFRLDFGSLVASVSYTQSFGPIMAGPVPIKPFVGGSISVEGRLAVGFDSYPQTLAVRGLDELGDVEGLEAAWARFDGGDVIEEGFYIDDLDGEGVDVPEVKMVTTIEAGAGVSIGIVTAGLKGGITLTINLDLNDPSGDGKLRAAEIRDVFAGDARCLFEVTAQLEAFIAVFVEIDLLLFSESWSFDLLRLGPYPLFRYGCEPRVPTLVVWEDGTLALTSGGRAGQRVSDTSDGVDEYEVRQFETADAVVYEVSGLNYVQRVRVDKATSGGRHPVTIYKPAVAYSTEKIDDTPRSVASLDDVRFAADGGSANDTLQFLQGEAFADDGSLVTTPFTGAVSASGGPGDDVIVTGDADDTVHGGDGADALDGGLGNDTLGGDAGDDVVDGGAGTDDLVGGSGADRLQGGPGADRADGGEGGDSVVGGPGRDIRSVLVVKKGEVASEVAAEQARVGFDSGDLLLGGAGVDVVDGGDGSDVVVGGTAASLSSGTVASHLTKRTRVVKALSEGATNPADVSVTMVTATVPKPAQLDTLCTSGDPLVGQDGTDYVTGGPEADVLVGSDGADVLDGGAGTDSLCGRNGDDDLDGDGSADPSRDPAQDVDVLRGGAGDDRLVGGAGDDVAFGDDVDLWRDGRLVLDGSLGSGASGAGADYLDGGDGDDVLSGGSGSDQLLGRAGADATYGEGRDTGDAGGPAPALADRLVACNLTTRVVDGYVDLDGDLLAGPTDLEGVEPDDGRLAGLDVAAGVVRRMGGTSALTGLLGGEIVVIDGRVDLDGDGTLDRKDTGRLDLPSVADPTRTNPGGDCILAGDGDDLVRGGHGSDHLGAGAGVDLVDGGDGNDLLLGDDGTDVVVGGSHHDVLVGGTGADHLVGGQGDDRLRGNEGDDAMVGGSETSRATDGQDVLLGGRGEDVVVGENGTVVSDVVVAAVTAAEDDAAWDGDGLLPATVLAGPGSAARFDGSAVACGTARPDRWVTLLAGGTEPRVPAASPGTPTAYDELYGGYDCDWVFGSVADDLVRGGQDDDVVEGGPGADLAWGDAGDDTVVGGSSTSRTTDARVSVDRSGAGTADAADTVRGDGGPDGEVGADLLAGDNATPVRRADGGYDLTLHDVALGTGAVATTTYGGDVLLGSDEREAEGADDDRVFGQGGDDTVTAGAGDDYVEGGSGRDRVVGGTGADDLLGGSSSASGAATRARLSAAVADRDASAAGVQDGVDTIDGGAGDDVVLGDNGRVTRPAAQASFLVGAARDVAMADLTPGATSGSDVLAGGDGDDVVYGQLDDATATLGSGDVIRGGAGNDAVVADLAVVTPTPASAISAPKRLVSRSGMVDETVYAAGSWVPVTSAPASMVGVGGSDIVHGDEGDDVLRLGAGDDLATGGADDDTVLGGAGDDALWGGTGHDRLFGGYGDDDLDRKVGAGAPSSWSSVAGQEDADDRVSTTNGADLIYGGWGADELQADQGGAGPQPGSDQLLDWVGNHNVYYVCDGAYGAGRVLRQSSPDVMDLLSGLVEAAGGQEVTTSGSGGFLDLGLVTNSDKRANNKPTPGAPGNFTCEGAG